ncbi:uncharacterized protein LOC110606213 [Manihot esculenta]|uniref:uncharacterized protein LOC110606213 n=1 Tax=Manihot esculenta TaxID=3983 RepID=UPI000B5D46B9|nr:uncharacterized protein LOC110606213 [Manihot esculenta]
MTEKQRQQRTRRMEKSQKGERADRIRKLHNDRKMKGSLFIMSVRIDDDVVFKEMRGARPQPRALIQGFREAVCDAGLTDFPMGGYPFTWEHGKDSDHWIEEKLDRVLVSNGWRYKFSYAQAYTLDITASDHLPIFLEVQSMVTRDHARRFKFENYWLHFPQCKEIVLNNWNSRMITNLEDRLKWKQRAKVFWLWEGDTNTRFFHAMATNRKRKNNVLRLQNSEGVW